MPEGRHFNLSLTVKAKKSMAVALMGETQLGLKNLRFFPHIAQFPGQWESMKSYWQRHRPASFHTHIFGILMAFWDHTGVAVEKKGNEGSTVV